MRRRARHVGRLPLPDQLRHLRDPLLVHIFGRQECVEQPFVSVRAVDRDFLHDRRSSQLVSTVTMGLRDDSCSRDRHYRDSTIENYHHLIE